MKKKKCKNISIQTHPKDFWDSLSAAVKAQINQGLADVNAGRYSSAKDVLERLMSE